MSADVNVYVHTSFMSECTSGRFFWRQPSAEANTGLVDAPVADVEQIDQAIVCVD